jgi:HAE1 family hydrophobic/amphiphilic exporter-1
LRTAASVPAVSQFLNVPVAQRAGVQLYVRNVAVVKDTTQEASTVTKVNGQEALGVDIMKQSGSNTVKVVADIKSQMESIKKELPAGVDLVVVRDNSKTIKESVEDVEFNLIVGGLLAIAVIFLFLGNCAAPSSRIAIPVSLSPLLRDEGVEFQSQYHVLAGIVACGRLLIDDAIVVIENIVRHLKMVRARSPPPWRARPKRFGGYGDDLHAGAVFVPVGMMNGIVGQLFKEFGITVAASVLVSLFVRSP